MMKDPSTLTATEHATTLVMQTIGEGLKQRAATAKALEAFENTGELQPLPAYEAPGALNSRARGWLKHLHRKATTPDDWSSSGVPHAWWDRYTSAPMMNFPRFDLQESAYAMALMADRTPAWREVYAEILDGLVQRYHKHWAAVDWLNQFGDDPDRAHYPDGWNGTLLPVSHWGDYNTPGWTANGTNPYPSKQERLGAPFSQPIAEYIQPDPIRAEAMLFFKGWMLLNMGLFARVSGDTEKYEKSFFMAGVNDQEFEWTHSSAADFVAEQWQSRQDSGGIH
jgi:hypothetical protein